MGVPNISVVEATVDGLSVGFTGFTGSGDAGGVEAWELNDTIDVFDFSGPIDITIDFDNAPIVGQGTNDPFVINSEGNLGTIFSDYTLTVNQDGVITLTIDRADFIQAGTASFVIEGRGDDGDEVRIRFICFAQGTFIDTPTGPKPIDELSKGDLVMTLGSGAKALSWVGSRTLNKAALEKNPHLQPITIQANALGPKNPSSDLTVSPQHRILLNTPTVQLHFWLEAALAPAKGLIDNQRVKISDQDSVTYYHLMFDRHEIVCSNGTWSESLFPGQQSMLALDDAARSEVLGLFPELAADDTGFEPAAPFLTVKETRVLAGQPVQHSGEMEHRGTP